MNTLTKLAHLINKETTQTKEEEKTALPAGEELAKSTVEKSEEVASSEDLTGEEEWETDSDESSCWDEEEVDESEEEVDEEEERPASRYADEGLNIDTVHSVEMDREAEVRTALGDVDLRPPSVYADRTIDTKADSVECDHERPPSRYVDEDMNSGVPLVLAEPLLSRPPSVYADRELAGEVTGLDSSYAEAWETDSDESFLEIAEESVETKTDVPRPESRYADETMNTVECTVCCGTFDGRPVCLCSQLLKSVLSDSPRPASCYEFDRPESRYADELLNAVLVDECECREEKPLVPHPGDHNLEYELNCCGCDLSRSESRYADELLNDALQKEEEARQSAERSELRPASRYCDDAFDLDSNTDLNGSFYCFEQERPESRYADEGFTAPLLGSCEEIKDDARPLSRYCDAELESPMSTSVVPEQKNVQCEFSVEAPVYYVDELMNEPLPNNVVCP